MTVLELNTSVHKCFATGIYCYQTWHCHHMTFEHALYLSVWEYVVWWSARSKSGINFSNAKQHCAISIDVTVGCGGGSAGQPDRRPVEGNINSRCPCRQ